MTIKITISDRISQNNGCTVVFTLYTNNNLDYSNQIPIFISNDELMICSSEITRTSIIYQVAIRKLRTLLLNASDHIELDNYRFDNSRKGDLYIAPKAYWGLG